MGVSLTAAVLVLGVGTFVGKYTTSHYTRALGARVVLIVLVVAVLVAPLDYDACSAWQFPSGTAIGSAFIVVICELVGTASNTVCGVAACTSALLFALASARHDVESGCGAALFGLSASGLALASAAIATA